MMGMTLPRRPQNRKPRGQHPQNALTPALVSVREYLEYLCDDAGVGFEAVADRDIGLAILTPNYASQWVAIRSILQRNQEVDDQASARIRELEADIRRHGCAQHHWGNTQLHDKIFLDAAHSMAAIGLIAPLMESLFGRIVTYFKDEQTWKVNCSRVGVAKAFLQIAEDIDLRRHLPDDLDTTAPALFAYRNKMFHCGLEWPEKDRTIFAERVQRDDWKGCFSRAESANEPWFFYMTQGFVERCLDTVYGIIDGVGAYARPIVWDDSWDLESDGHNDVTPALAAHEVNRRVLRCLLRDPATLPFSNIVGQMVVPSLDAGSSRRWRTTPPHPFFFRCVLSRFAVSSSTRRVARSHFRRSQPGRHRWLPGGSGPRSWRARRTRSSCTPAEDPSSVFQGHGLLERPFAKLGWRRPPLSSGGRSGGRSRSYR